jgi:diacylglycerol kinase (ATP)
MTTVAVVAHREKTLGEGLAGLRARLHDHGVTDPLWYEVDKSRKAAKAVRRAVRAGADLVLVWGGDGTVQRALDAAVGQDGPAMAILPAGTANLLATNLGIPIDLDASLAVALEGRVQPLDLGRVNGEHFAVMAGAGFDALVMRGADAGLKSRVGRVAYLWAGVRALSLKPARMRIDVDGRRWFRGRASCLLVGNMGDVFGGVELFPDARPDDGLLEVGVVTAENAWQWLRTLGRSIVAGPDGSPFVRSTRGRRIDVTLQRPMPYEIDGGDRPATRTLKIRVRPGAVRVRVPLRTGLARGGATLVGAATA